MGAKIGKNGRPVGPLADGLIGGVNLQNALKLVKNGTAVKPVVSSIYGVKLVSAETANGKASRIIG